MPSIKKAAPKVAPSPIAVLSPVPRLPAKPKFVTETGSPFPDGYSIKGEEAALADFLASEERLSDEHDPEYDRYAELVDRRDRLELEQARYKTRRGAEGVVEPAEFFGIDELGPLVDEEVDRMEVHTLEAYRMFMGRARMPGADVQPIIGGKRVAAALRQLWTLTANDNPYADWALLRHEETMKEVQVKLAREVRTATDLIDQQRARGLTFSILQSNAPKALALGFRSPYGYAVASLISDFDYYVRLQKTMARKNLRSDDQVRQAIAALTRSVRRVFNETARFDRWLMRDEVRGMARIDFTPGASEEGRKRVEFATGVFGPVPSLVYSCELQPRHSRRRIQVSAADRKLLQTVAADMKQAEETAEPAEAAPTNSAVAA